MDAYHPHIPFPKSDYFPDGRTDERTHARTEFGNLILCAPTYKALRAIRTPLNADFDPKFSICSYFLKFSLKSKFMVLLFSKIPSKKFCLRRKIPTHFFRMRCYFTLYTGSKPCKTGPKFFACGAKWTTF